MTHERPVYVTWIVVEDTECVLSHHQPVRQRRGRGQGVTHGRGGPGGLNIENILTRQNILGSDDALLLSAPFMPSECIY